MLIIVGSTFFIYLFGLFSLLGINQTYFQNQLLFFLIAIVVFFIFKKIGRQFFYQNSYFFYYFFIFLLVITYFIGFEVKGSKRWLDFYFFNFQPSEIFKIFFIIFFSRLLMEKENIDKRLVFLKSLFYFLLPFLIILKQPDLANALCYFFVFFVLVLFSRLPKKYLLYFVFSCFLLIPFFWFFLKPYQKARILSFFNPHLDLQGDSYNMWQSIIAIGSGRFFGKGLGLGTQSRLYFLPENNTDFAFASLVEQFGFLGGFMAIFFYFLIFISLIKKTTKLFYERESKSKENFLLSLGILAYFLFQVGVNIGMNLGLLPVAGVALPLISYGGSSLVSFFISLALLPY
ncbi:MAG: FtsW/RodA/SpoVE family cell cycle protein [Patescibacteria group bacterium]|nr:FtsW/RodA/SpoVE family cell cycle protein [Patescibacteria group bacterium]